MFFIGSCCVFLLLLFYFFLVLAHFYALPLLESFSLFYFHSCIYLYIELAALYSLALYLYLPLFVFVKYAMAYTQHLKERIKRLKPYYFALLSYAYLGFHIGLKRGGGVVKRLGLGRLIVGEGGIGGID